MARVFENTALKFDKEGKPPGRQSAKKKGAVLCEHCYHFISSIVFISTTDPTVIRYT